MKSTRNVVISGVMMIASVTTACAQETLDPKMWEQLEAVVDSLTGTIDVRGRVVSADGEPLTDVTVKYFFREFGDVLTGEEIDRKTKKFDGDFRIKQSGVSSVALSVFKEGYYSQNWSFGFDGEVPQDDPSNSGKFDIEFVLEKKAASAPLRKHLGILRADVTGALAVLEVQRQSSGESWLVKNGERRDLKWPHILFETADTGTERLSVVEYVPPDSRHPKPGLERGWIRFNEIDPGDGFVVYEPSMVNVHRPVVGMRGMTTAPETGYSEKLELMTEDGIPMVFFYLRLKGRFGKGMVTGRPFVTEEDGRELARVLVEIYINPTGSRDVGYDHP